jgi:hypothetical protein
MGVNEVAREFNHSNFLNGGVQVFGGAVDVDIGEEVRRLDGVVSSARSSEVVCSGDWRLSRIRRCPNQSNRAYGHE